MIITLSGAVTYRGSDFIVLEAAGVGHQVFVLPTLLSSLPVGENARLWTHEHLREDAHDLYGFVSPNELRLFKRLVDISGVGPRMALNILGLGPLVTVEQAIENGDIETLSHVPRVGRKTAQKIVLELKGKLVESGDGEGENGEVVAALVNLGYSREQARAAVSASGDAHKNVEAKLRAALRHLGKK